MDVIGVGSLPIVILIGFFTGVVITMQMSRALAQYGAVDQVGPIVAITLVRELGPVLTAILVAGRNASGIASELGSMKVTEQIDAMRGLGTSQYWTSAYRAIEYNDITQGLLKPFVFAFMVSLVGCFYGLRTTGGTQGVGHATTQAVVVSSVWIFVLTSLLTRIFVNLQ